MSSFWSLFSTFLSACIAVCVKATAEEYSFYEILTYRSLFSLIVSYGLLKYYGISLSTHHPWLHLGRCAAGVVAMSLSIVTVQHLELGAAQALQYTAPLFTSTFVLSSLLLRDGEIDWPLLIIIAVGFFGVCLILRPSYEAGQIIPVLTGLFGGFFIALATWILRSLGREKEPEIRTVFFFSLSCTLCGLPAMLICHTAENQTPLDIAFLFAIGLMGVAAQLALSRGWGRGIPLLNAVFQFAGILFAVFLGVVFFDEWPDILSWLGLMTILICAFAASYMKLKRRPVKSLVSE